MIKFGGIKINEMHFGNKRVTEVYLGVNRVWPTEIIVTHALENLEMHIFGSSSTIMGCTENDFAVIMGDYVTYENGVETNRETVSCDPVIASVSSAVLRFFKIVDQRIYFNRDEYGTTDLSTIFSNYIYTTWNAEYAGVKSTENVYNQMVVNKVEYTQDMQTGQLFLVVTPTEFNSDETLIQATATGYVNTETYYTSGMSKSGTRQLTSSDSISFYLDGEYVVPQGAGSARSITVSAWGGGEDGTSDRTLTVSASFNRINKSVEVTQKAPAESWIPIYQIDDAECMQCGACYDSCPVDALWYDDEGTAHIRPDECINCGSCYNVGCPTGAIRPARLYNDGHIEWAD